MSETPNPAMLKLGAAAAGGYVLGRFKKGRTAVGLALWVAGARSGLDPRRLLREGLVAVLRTPEAQEVLGQLRGPVLQAGRRAAAATLESQAGALAKALEQRTAALTSGAPGKPAEDEDPGRKDAEDEYDEESEEPEDEEPEEEPEERRDDERDDEPRDDEPEKRRPRKATGRQRRGESSDESRGKPSGEPKGAARSEDRPRKRSGQSSRSAQEGRTPRRPRKEGARA